MRKTFAAAALAAALLGATAAAAADESTGSDSDPAEMAREGVEMLMRALGAFIDTIPQYEMPELNENGDIIIRRKNPPKSDDPEPETKPEVEETRT